MNNVIVFDLDGVITSEEAYWITAGLVLHELLYSPRYWNIRGSSHYVLPATSEECACLSRAVLPESIMLGLKAHSVNSNWDTCYAAVCLCLIDLLALLPQDRCQALLSRPSWDADWMAEFRQAFSLIRQDHSYDPVRAYVRFSDAALSDYAGLELFDRYNRYANEVLDVPVEGIFARYSQSWLLCQDLFQEWYLGDEFYTREYGHHPAQTGKSGCIYLEQPLLPREQLSSTLATLKDQGYTLAVATGRPGAEAIVPLKNYGLFDYFDPQRVMTHAEVAQAEVRLRAQGEVVSLVKPHPYQFAVAQNPDYQPGQPFVSPASFVVVGDTPSDVCGGHAAGALVIAVLSGARTAEARRLLEQSQPDFLVADVTYVPDVLARIDDLVTIQRLQFQNRSQAELLLRRWFVLHMDLSVDDVTLTPRPVSLNSFNGVYRIGSDEFFFKTHVEEQGILEEYYHAEFLYNAGYNIVRPLRTIHQKGQQMVIYPVVRAPVVFDLMRAVETGQAEQVTADLLIAAERHECERLLEIYRETLAASSAEEHAQAPIHQLFWHRITGGRLDTFYTQKHVPFPRPVSDRSGIHFTDLLHYRWIINDVEVVGPGPTLGKLLDQARVVLNPARASHTVIGHGDAHFGNVFLEDQQRYRYFDPAFAGRHSPLLDIVKPLFHNVYASWMYFPVEVDRDLQITVHLTDDCIVVTHNYEIASVRREMLHSKEKYLIQPLIEMLHERQALPEDWNDILRLALLCCPLLTVDLLDSSKRSPAICWLGLSQVMQMGNSSFLPGNQVKDQHTYMDQVSGLVPSYGEHDADDAEHTR